MKLIQRIFLSYYINKFKLISIVSPRKAAESAFQLFCTPYSKKETLPEPTTFSDADKISIEIDGKSTRGFHWKGNRSNGCKILICHGFDSRTYYFEKYVTALLNKDFEVLAFDAPAHGLSEGKTINVAMYRDMIIKIDGQLGPIDGFISHSFGGLAVALALDKMPDNLDKRLVYIAPATETTSAINNFFSVVKVSDTIKIEFENHIKKLSGFASSWFSVARVVQEIKTPTLWIHDKKDTITPYADMMHLVDLPLPHVTFEITEGLGHSQIYRNEDIVKKAVSFFEPFKNQLGKN